MNSISYTHGSILSNVPSELAELKRWILWRMEYRDGVRKGRKVPFYVSGQNRSGDLGGQKDLSLMVNLKSAKSALDEFESKNDFEGGIGFCFIDGDNITGIDLDNCFDENGNPSDVFNDIYTLAESYTEYSPSGNGAHIIVKGKTESAKSKSVEVYSSGRFFCFTGDIYGKNHGLQGADDELFRLVHDIASSEKKAAIIAKTSRKEWSETAPSNDDVEIAREALTYIPSDDYETWVQCGMALKAKFGDQGFGLWDEWSRTSSKYDQGEMPSKWGSFKRDGLNLGSVIAMAKVGGFKFTRKEINETAYKPSEAKIVNDGQEKKVIVSESTWDDPTILVSKVSPPPVNYSLIPSTLADFIKDQSERIGCDAGCLFAACLCAVAGVTSDSIKVKVKRFDNSWRERACLWGAFVGRPSEKKTPATAAAFSPIYKIAHELDDEFAELDRVYQAEKEAYDAWKKKKNKGDDEIRIHPTQPVRRRVCASTATIEALQGILKDNTNGILTIHDELASWFGSMDVYSKGGSARDRPMWLELYNGGFKSFDYVGRGYLSVENWSSSLYGNIQPEAIRSITDKLPDDGLLQRFFVICSSTGSGEGCDRPVNENARREYSRLIRYCKSLADIEFSLSEDAHEVRESFARWVKSMVACDIGGRRLEGALGKYEGLMMRIALVYHVIDCFQCGELANKISRQTIEIVSDLMRKYIFPHAVSFYNNVLDSQREETNLLTVAGYLLTCGQDVVTQRDLQRNRSAWRDATQVQRDKIIEALEIHGWIAPDYAFGVSTKNGMPKRWMINPKIKVQFADMAEREAKRIESAKDAIKMCSEIV